MIVSLGLVFLAVFLTGISQLLLKIGSQKGGASAQFFAAYLNVYTISAYAIFLVVTVISVIALLEVPLKLLYTITSLNFVVVAFLSWAILKEKITGNMVIAIVLICLGTIIFNI
jgi:drug/metabolite transporter (DMT)-like permease